MHVDRVGILSSEYHIRRVRWTFNTVFEEDADQLVFLASDSSDFSPEDWWKHEKSFLIVFSEYTKLLFYLLNY
jgi:hypothetical protein